MRFLSPGGGGTLACWLSPFAPHSQLSHQQHKPHFGSLVGQLAACTAQPRECSKRQQRRGARAPLRQAAEIEANENRARTNGKQGRRKESNGPSSTSCLFHFILPPGLVVLVTLHQDPSSSSRCTRIRHPRHASTRISRPRQESASARARPREAIHGRSKSRGDPPTRR